VGNHGNVICAHIVVDALMHFIFPITWTPRIITLQVILRLGKPLSQEVGLQDHTPGSGPQRLEWSLEVKEETVA
jgi:hypothetical protein